jgi:hypothetical protein
MSVSPSPSVALSQSTTVVNAKTSPWIYFRDAMGDEPKFRGGGKKKERYCTLYEQTPFSTAYTTNAKRHLKNEHDIEIDSSKNCLRHVLFSANNITEPKSNSATVHADFDYARYMRSLILLICRRRLPLNCVTWPEWLDFCLSLNPTAEKQLITSRSTVVSHITSVYSEYRKGVHERLQKAKSLVHLSADLWTSPSRVSFVGICGHLIDENYTLQRMLLGLPECQSGHSGPEQAAHIMDMVRHFGVAQKLGYFTCDNASSNNTCLQAISTTLRSEYGVSILLLFIMSLI